MKEYLKPFGEVLAEVNSSEAGLTSAEAKARLEKNGKNKLKEAKKESLFHRFLMQLADPMIIILIVAAIVSAITAAFGGDSEGYADVVIILFVVVINAVLGVYQESKAEKAIEALQEIAAATSNVIRDGRTETVRTEDLVVGDIVVLEAGNSVPADCRIIANASMKIEEAALTGESVPVNKQSDPIDPEGSDDVPLGDRKNMCYMGSNVVYGHGKAVVVATGMDTEMGKIADALNDSKDGETPLQIKLNQLSKVLSFLVLGICVFIFALDVIRSAVSGAGVTFDGMLGTFMVAVSLAVAAIPEGLAAVVTIVLSIGVTKMSKRSAVIRKLTAVETLGCTQVICSDKTGTLTQNKMTVVDFKGENEKLIAQAMALCSDAELEDGIVKGEPTEAALVEWANKLEMPKYDLEKDFPRVAEAPFDSMRKMMSTVHAVEGKMAVTYVQYTKGAPDVVLNHCTKAFIGGKMVDMTDAVKAEIMAQNKAMADQALRVLCVATRTYKEKPESEEADFLEKELCYIGLAGMIDPVRPEVVGAIAQCRSAGIRPIMITGDHKDTAVAIAKQLGIVEDASEALTGAELNKISDEELDESIEKYSVYARVQPEHKVRIVKAWRKKEMVTAMTGDGVNDAPSIKSADIGVGMGITGTDVTKNVADMVLADDNFATIVSAVEEGRRIYDNIRKSIQFLLSSNLSEVLTIFVATILGFTILEPVHLLWINLITDCFPALALGMEKGEGNIMQRAPRSSKDGIFANGMGFDVAWQGVMVTVATLAAYVFGIIMASETKVTFGNIFSITDEFVHQNGMTMAFLTLSMAEIFHSFNMRSRRESIFRMKNQNMFLIGAMVLSLFLSTAVIYVPFLARAFDFAPISFAEYVVSMAIAVAVVPVVEIVKAIERAIEKKSNK